MHYFGTARPVTSFRYNSRTSFTDWSALTFPGLSAAKSSCGVRSKKKASVRLNSVPPIRVCREPFGYQTCRSKRGVPGDLSSHSSLDEVCQSEYRVRLYLRRQPSILSYSFPSVSPGNILSFATQNRRRISYGWVHLWPKQESMVRYGGGRLANQWNQGPRLVYASRRIYMRFPKAIYRILLRLVRPWQPCGK